MKRRLISFVSILLMITLYFSSLALAGGKVDICHNPPGEPGLWHTITIPENAISAHLAHGDTVGQCDSGCEGPSDCNDGNLCTTDNCENGECIHAPTDCDDGISITQDFCKPYEGCIYIADCPEGSAYDPVAGDCIVCPSPIYESAQALMGLMRAIITSSDTECSFVCGRREGTPPDEGFKTHLEGICEGLSPYASWDLWAGGPDSDPTLPYRWYFVTWIEYHDYQPYVKALYIEENGRVDAINDLRVCQQVVLQMYYDLTGVPCNLN